MNIWCVGLPIALYLCFFSSPIYGLEGLWIGLLVGLGLQVFITFLTFLLMDWQKITRKIKFWSHFTEDLLYYVSYQNVLLSPLGSRSLGGFLLTLPTLSDELQEIEAVENPLVH